eukprot:scaffold2274_cov343-Pavlova_lutheri.AAC.12
MRALSLPRRSHFEHSKRPTRTVPGDLSALPSGATNHDAGSPTGPPRPLGLAVSKGSMTCNTCIDVGHVTRDGWGQTNTLDPRSLSKAKSMKRTS